jgi:hypothetical protein
MGIGFDRPRSCSISFRISCGEVGPSPIKQTDRAISCWMGMGLVIRGGEGEATRGQKGVEGVKGKGTV